MQQDRTQSMSSMDSVYRRTQTDRSSSFASVEGAGSDGGSVDAPPSFDRRDDMEDYVTNARRMLQVRA
jgi:hypothetical protein